MRCLYIVAQHPISPNFRGGGSAIFYDQLRAISALGHDVHLWHQADAQARSAFDEFVAGDVDTYDDVKAMCRSVTLTEMPTSMGVMARLRAKVLDSLHGERIDNPYFRTVAFGELQGLLRRVRPDFIWAQHLGPAQCAVLQSAIPVIYTHHDWLYKVKALAQDRAPDERRRKIEERVAKSAAVVVSGSATECAQLRRLGCAAVEYIPVAYDAAPWHPQAAPAEPARLVHLGGLGTTANRIGLERFFQVVWPHFTGIRPELWIVGDISAAGERLEPFLSQVRCTGFVADVGSVLRPYDLHLIPWEHDTGTRTRLPLVFNYGQVLVATRASVAGIPEAQDGKNCRLVGRLEEMGAVIEELRQDPSERIRLGRAARATFEQRFTRDVLSPRYQAAIHHALTGLEITQ